MVAFASSLDQAGPIARTVEDAAILLKSMSGHDAKDSTSLDIEVPDFPSFVGKSVKGLRIGIPKEYRVDGMPAEIEKLWEQGIAWLKDAGCEIVEVSLPHTKYALPAYYIVAPAEASSNVARYDGMRFGLRVEGGNLTETYENTRAAGFGTEVKRRILDHQQDVDHPNRPAVDQVDQFRRDLTGELVTGKADDVDIDGAKCHSFLLVWLRRLEARITGYLIGGPHCNRFRVIRSRPTFGWSALPVGQHLCVGRQIRTG